MPRSSSIARKRKRSTIRSPTSPRSTRTSSRSSTPVLGRRTTSSISASNWNARSGKPPMFLLDDILMLPMKLPIAGFNWIMKQIQTMANEELLNDQPWKERLIELQMMLEVGDITEEDYAVQEAQVFQALREIRARREELARQQRGGDDDDDGGVGIYTGYGQ